jgi:hypothetical protein
VSTTDLDQRLLQKWLAKHDKQLAHKRTHLLEFVLAFQGRADLNHAVIHKGDQDAQETLLRGSRRREDQKHKHAPALTKVQRAHVGHVMVRALRPAEWHVQSNRHAFVRHSATRQTQESKGEEVTKRDT